MATRYDESILQAYADDLYNQASTIIFMTAAKYFCYSLVFSVLVSWAFVLYILHDSIEGGGPVFLGVVVITGLGMWVGISEGRRKSFRLKLEAQELLCQRQIELNTRTATATTAAGKAASA